MSGSKPLFVICVGTGWSATTPLYYTLRDSKVCDAFIKESNLLCPNLDFSEKYAVTGEEIYLNPTIDGYIELLKRKKKDNFMGVCDFTTSYAAFTGDNIRHFAEKLQQSFDVKILMIFRDPVARLFSHISHLIQVHQADVRPNAFMKEILFYLRKFPDKQEYPSQHANFRRRNYEPFLFANYETIYKTWSSFFDTYCMSMEKLWSDDNELQRLNTFLGANITSLHKNVYYPDLGPNAPKVTGLADQYTSDTEFILPEVYDMAKRMMSRHYLFYENLL